MVNMGLIVIAFASAGLAGWNVARKQYYKKQVGILRGEYGKQRMELVDARRDVERLSVLYESEKKSNSVDMCRIREYEHLTVSGYRNLKVKEYNLPDISKLPKYSIDVVGQDTINPDLFFVVKSFTADNEEDRDFAIRQAEELIETIQKF